MPTIPTNILQAVNGLPTGGSIGQWLRKSGAADYEAEWATIQKADVGLANVDNTSDLAKPISTATQAALNLKQANLIFFDDGSPVNTGGDVDTIDFVGGAISATRLGNVLTVSVVVGGVPDGNKGDITVSAGGTVWQLNSGVIVDADISASAAIAQSKINGLVSDLAGRQPLDADLTAIAALAPSDDEIIQRKSGAWTSRTPAQLKVDLVLVKADVGLANVDNTSDLSKPISTLTQAALDLKQPIDADLTAIAALTPSNNDLLQRKAGEWTNRTPAQVKVDLALVKDDVGLANVDNTSDLAKPISTATQTALDTKQPDIQFQDEGSNVGTAGGVTTINFVGAGVSAAFSSGTLTVTIAGGGGGVTDGDKGDIVVSGGGATWTIDAGVIVDSQISASAAIAQTKISGLVSDLAGKQPIDADLTAIAALAPSDDDFLQRKAGAWTNRSRTQVLVDLALYGSIGITIDGGGSAIATGIAGDIVVPFNGVIESWSLVADQSGSIVIDVWKDILANHPPTVADTIAGTEKPTLSAAIQSSDTNLTTWTTTVSAGDVIRFNVDSAAIITRATLVLRVRKT